MAFTSKYTGEQIDALLDAVGQGGGGGDAPSSRWTGHADAEGLRAIGWTDEDIAYYQEHGVNWNAEDDEYHKVTDDNKALYGVLTADNISDYKDRIVYLPKIEIKSNTGFVGFFYNFFALVGLPILDTSKMEDATQMFYGCRSLTYIPPLDFSKTTKANSTFYSCYSLSDVPSLDFSNATDMASIFYGCRSLVEMKSIKANSSTTLQGGFYGCSSLVCLSVENGNKITSYKNLLRDCSCVRLLHIDAASCSDISDALTNAYGLYHAYIKNISTSTKFNSCPLLSKESLLYIINNESAKTSIVLTLRANAYARLSEDNDIKSALANHPNISLASA